MGDVSRMRAFPFLVDLGRQQGVLNVRIFSLCATLVAGVLFVGIYSSLSAQTQPAQPASSASAGGGRVAVIDIGYIFRNHDRFKQALDQIKVEYENYEKQVREQQQAMTAKAEQLKALPAGSPEYRALEEELAGASTRMRLDLGRKQKERVDKEAKVYFNAYSEIERSVQRFADQYRVDLVVRYNSEEMDPNKPESVLQGINKFIVFHRGLDISNHILTDLKAQTPPGVRMGTNPAAPAAQTAPLRRG